MENQNLERNIFQTPLNSTKKPKDSIKMDLAKAKGVIHQLLKEKQNKETCDAVFTLMSFYQGSLSKLKEELIEMEEFRDEERQQAKKHRDSYFQLKNQMEDRLNSLKQKKADNSNQLFDLQSENNELKQRLENSESLLQSRNEQIQQLGEMLKESEKTADKNAELLEESLKNRNEINKLKQENRIYEDENRMVEQKLNDKEDEINQLRNELKKEKEKYFEDMEQKFKDYNQCIEDRNRVIQSQTKKIDKLENDIEEYQLKIKENQFKERNLGFDTFEPKKQYYKETELDFKSFSPLEAKSPSYDKIDQEELEKYYKPNKKEAEKIAEPFTPLLNSDSKSKSAKKNILSFPAHNHIENNLETITDLNKHLNTLLARKNELEGKLCKFPDNPKSIELQMELEKCEEEYAKVRSGISSIKRKLKGYNKY